MINTYRNKELLEVDDVTSWPIGWTDYEPLYSELNPAANRQKSKAPCFRYPTLNTNLSLKDVKPALT